MEIDYPKVEELLRKYFSSRSPLDKMNALWEIGYLLDVPNLMPNGMLTPAQQEHLEKLVKLMRFNMARVLRESIAQFLDGQPFEAVSTSEGVSDGKVK